MSVRMKMTRSKTGMRRSHHRADEARLSQCTNCEDLHVRHTLCKTCGFYRGKQVLDVTLKNKKAEARAKQKQDIRSGTAPTENSEAVQDEKPTVEHLPKEQK